jgi:hypothetical protein
MLFIASPESRSDAPASTLTQRSKTAMFRQVAVFSAMSRMQGTACAINDSQLTKTLSGKTRAKAPAAALSRFNGHSYLNVETGLHDKRKTNSAIRSNFSTARITAASHHFAGIDATPL